MSFRNYFKFLLIVLTVAISNVSAGEPVKKDNQGPVAVISNPRFETAPVIEGDDITHDFVIKNTGTSTLAISRVKTG